jgi:hypothetical protein
MKEMSVELVTSLYLDALGAGFVTAAVHATHLYIIDSNCIQPPMMHALTFTTHMPRHGWSMSTSSLATETVTDHHLFQP